MYINKTIFMKLDITAYSNFFGKVCINQRFFCAFSEGEYELKLIRACIKRDKD